MRILAKKLSIQEFSIYLNNKAFGNTPPDSIVLHHTWKPTKQDWRGQYTIESLKKFYERKGWSAGPHIFVAEDGIWLFTDMYSVGIHAGEGNATYKHPDGRTYSGYAVPSSMSDSHNFRLKSYSIGIEVVGNYNQEVWLGDTRENAFYCIDLLMRKLNISNENLFFHRDFSPKTCPGTAISKDWIINEIKNLRYKNDNNNGGDIVGGEYKIKYDETAVNRAKNLGIIKKVDTETRELIAIGSMRVIDYLERRMDSLEMRIKNLRNN